MCEKCPEERQRITEKYGVVVVAMLYSPAGHALTYDIMLGPVQIAVTLPIVPSMADQVECATFIGEHFNQLLAASSQAFMQREAEQHTASTIADLEALLRDSPDS